MARHRKNSTSTSTIAEQISIAVTLLCLPGGLLYLAAILSVAFGWIDVSENLMLLMMLAFSGFGLFVIALAGLVATILQGWRKGSFQGILQFSLVVQGGIVVGMLLLWWSGWQIG